MSIESEKEESCTVCDSGRVARYEIKRSDGRYIYVCNLCWYEMNERLKQMEDRS